MKQKKHYNWNNPADIDYFLRLDAEIRRITGCNTYVDANGNIQPIIPIIPKDNK